MKVGMNKSARSRIVGCAALGLLVFAWGSGPAAAKWANSDLLLSAEALNANVDKSNWVVVDCRSLKDYAKGHIPGAISFGDRCKKALRDATARVFRDSEKYEKLLGAVGIGNDTHVVFYGGDLGTLLDATVGFWIMEYLGHDKVHVLDGGVDAWRKAGYRLDNKLVKRDPTTFKANVVAGRYGETSEILQIASGEVKNQLVDSRTKKEFDGKDIRAIRGGHVPNVTVNVSHIDTLKKEKNAKTGKMEPVPYLDADAAEKAFGALDKSKRTLAYCQTGTRSTLTYLQLRALGFNDVANWDESWRVYGSQISYPAANEQWFNFAGLNNKLKSLEKKVAQLEKKSESGK